jgi:uncharacterized protein
MSAEAVTPPLPNPGEEPVAIATSKGDVSGLWAWPATARAGLAVAHGAGGDMHAALLRGFTACLNEIGVGTLRFNFPYSERGRKSPDQPAVLIETVRAVSDEARRRAPNRRILLGGKSMGGRIASMAVAEGLPADGLIFLGYPLHPPGRTERLRDEHLSRVHAPMLFLQGTRDDFARFDLIAAVVKRLGSWAHLHWVEGGDHSFRVKGQPKDDERTGRLLASVTARFIQNEQG